MGLKLAFLGAWLFGFGTIAFLYLAIYRHLPPNTAVAADTSSLTLRQRILSGGPRWWPASYWVVPWWDRPRQGSAVLWGALGLTFLVPAGSFVVFLVIAAKLREAVK
jgi:hypothetical protein